MDVILNTAIKYGDIFIMGTKITIFTSLIATFVGLLLGILLALFKMNIFKIPPLYWFTVVYVEIIRGTPLLVQIALAFFGLPLLGIQFPSVEFMGVEVDRMFAGIFALTINMSAYACEIIRSGVQSIDSGQMEAAKSLGFSSWHAMQKIVLPQALKNLLPVLGNEFIVMVKASSQVSVIGLADLMFSATTVQGISFQPFPPLVIVAVVYLIMTLIISALVRMMEVNLNKSNSK